MKYSDFIGEVQDRLGLPSQAKAVRASRAVLKTLSERLYPGEASDLAGALPLEIDYFVESAESGQGFSRDEFIERVAERAETDKAEAFRHIQLVIGLVSEIVPLGEMDDIQSELPDEFEDFFDEVEG